MKTEKRLNKICTKTAQINTSKTIDLLSSSHDLDLFLKYQELSSVPGLSDVVSGYVRPKLDELRAVVELLE